MSQNRSRSYVPQDAYKHQEYLYFGNQFESNKRRSKRLNQSGQNLKYFDFPKNLGNHHSKTEKSAELPIIIF